MHDKRTAHTPGPYTIQQLESAHHGYEDWPTFAIRSPQNVCLATVGDVDRYQSGRIPANARLFASAPALLAALEQTVTALEHWFPRYGDPEGVNSLMMQQARTAIEQARG